jgi:hypothetical protein
VVSAAFFAYILSDMEIGAVVERMTLHVVLHFVPPLLIFLVVSLLIEAVCLMLVVSHSGADLDLSTAARVKSASYLLGLLNYALGAGALTLLLRRRARMPLADAAGAVLLIGLFDLGSILVLVLLASGLMGSDTPGVQAGIVLLAGGAIVAGFGVLRAPISMGALDRLRDLQVFRAARTLPVALLAQLGVLRFAFIASFIGLAWAALLAFDISVPALFIIVNVSILLLVAVLPIAAAGLGTGQLAFVALFERWADPEALLAASLTLSIGLIITRATLGTVFAREYASEALAATKEAEA